MSSDRKKPGVAFWATVVLVAVLLGYPLSLGPASWAYSHGLIPKSAESALVLFYSPLRWIREKGPAPIRAALDWYASLGG